MMKMTIAPTAQLVAVAGAEGTVHARVWEGTTEGGIAVQVLVTRVAARADADTAELERALRIVRAPIPPTGRAFDTRLVI